MTPGTEKMLQVIEDEVRYTRSMIGRQALDPQVLKAMAEVPRHEFVPDHERAHAYANGPLPIGHGQTISQPYMVALMTDLLECGPHARVLEVGTGCGYQAAVLSRVVSRVYTVEIIPELARDAAARLARMGYTNIESRHGDGNAGWSEHAPYDGILVTACAPTVPGALIEQLKEGARLVIPVGPAYGHQKLMMIHKQLDGSLQTREVLAVAFVPMTRARSSFGQG